MRIPFFTHSCLFKDCPAAALGSSCCTWPKTCHSIKQASGLTPDTLKAEPPPNLASEDCQLSLITPPFPSPPAFHYLHVLKPSCGQIVDKKVNILGCFSPSAEDPSPEGRERKKPGLQRSYYQERDMNSSKTKVEQNRRRSAKLSASNVKLSN